MMGNLGSRACQTALRTPTPRSIGDTHPGCISRVQNVEIPMESQVILSKQTARDAELSSGNKMPQEVKAASRKATGMHNWADRAGNGDTHAERRGSGSLEKDSLV